MSLRVRLLLMIGVALALLWGAGAFWMQADLKQHMRSTLDHRLEMSAWMVADLVEQNPSVWNTPSDVRTQARALVQEKDGIFCQIGGVHGEVYARTMGVTGSAMASVTPGFSEQTVDGQAWRTYTLEAHGLRITTADRNIERSALLERLMLSAVLPFVVALVGGLAVLWLGVGRALQPLERLRQQIGARPPDAKALVPVDDTPVELLPFVTTLNEMLGRIDATLSRERRFTSDAAHELRTPLTAIKIHLDVLRLSQGEAAKTALDHVDEGVERLQGALVQLLTLAQVEGQPSWDEQDCADADQVARLAIRDAAPNGDARLQLSGKAEGLLLALPQALAVTALRNLIDNARRHAPPDGWIMVDVSLSGDSVTYTVRDNGAGMSADDIAKATERFWRRGSGVGSGLGLSIVQALADRFNGQLSLSQIVPHGLEATLRLPLKAKIQS
nr:ATP-binding protein [uncultured Undibacterium sp.]